MMVDDVEGQDLKITNNELEKFRLTFQDAQTLTYRLLF